MSGQGCGRSLPHTVARRTGVLALPARSPSCAPPYPQLMALLRHAGRPSCNALLFHSVLRLQNCVWLDALHFHDLRGTTSTMLAGEGCTPSQIAAMFGWRLPHQRDAKSLPGVNSAADRFCGSKARRAHRDYGMTAAQICAQQKRSFTVNVAAGIQFSSSQLAK